MSIEGACSACRVTHDHGRRDWPSADHRTGPPAFALVRVPLIFGRREQPLGRVAGKAEEESIAELSATMTTQPDADRVARSRLKIYGTPLRRPSRNRRRRATRRPATPEPVIPPAVPRAARRPRAPPG